MVTTTTRRRRNYCTKYNNYVDEIKDIALKIGVLFLGAAVGAAGGFVFYIAGGWRLGFSSEFCVIAFAVLGFGSAFYYGIVKQEL